MTETKAENSKRHVDSKRTVAVLGMHRSGTSAVAGLLAKMGLSFGAESALLPASSDNPKGYFEHRKLVAANQVLLVGQQASWLQVQDYGTPSFDCAAVAASVQARFEGLAVELLDSLGAQGPRALKDPRLCLTLPCWRQLLPDLVCIHVTRNPVAVARSLERRADMPVPVGIALWELYSRRVLVHTGGIPTFRVRFEDFIRDPARISGRIRDFLLDAGVSGVNVSAVEAATEAVDAGLVHQVGADAPLDQLLTAPQLALLSYLENDDVQAAEAAGQLSTGAEMILAAHEQSLTELHRLMALGPGETCAELERSLRQAEADRDELMRLCESFRNSARAAFESLSWRSGTMLKRLVLTATRREEGPTAEKHVRHLSGHFDRWQRQLARRSLGGPSAASLAALWMRLNGHKQIMIAALLDEDEVDETDDIMARRVALPLALSRADISVLPVLPDDLPRSPADVILARVGVCEDESQARVISARARAMNVPIVCIVAGSSAKQGHFSPEAAAPGALRPADIILADAAQAIVAFDDATADRLRREGYDARVMPSERSVSAEADRMTSFSPDDAAFWQTLLSALSPPPPAGCRTPSFDWSRLPLLNPGHFDAAAYLSQNPEISAAIADGQLSSALEHWQAHGYRECQRGERLYVSGVILEEGGHWRFTDAQRQEIQDEIAGWEAPPLISVLMPTWNSDPQWLGEAVQSVFAQAYPHWELCIADDGSTREETLQALARLTDRRVKLQQLPENKGIANASNAALSIAAGDYIALLDHDDLLTEDALYLVALHIVKLDPDILYSDEDKVSTTGELSQPFHKPDFAPEQLLGQNYISHLGVYRRSLVERVGGFRDGFEGAQDFDLLLRCSARATNVAHIPHCLYHWRMIPGSTAERFESKDYAWENGRRAVQAALDDRNIDAAAELGLQPGTYRVRRRIQGKPSVSVIVPFRDQPALLQTCMESLLAYTSYERLEILGISNDSSEPRTFELMQHYEQHDARIRFLRYDIPFNYSRINNYAVGQTTGEHLLFLNNDIEVLSAGWLDALLEHSQRPEVGCVGARLLYPDRTIQHAGVVMGLHTLAGHAFRFHRGDHPGYFNRDWVTHEVSVVTGACMMTKRSVFEAAQGFNEADLPVAFNDVDLCLRIRELGYINIYTPWCELIHHESKSRGCDDTPEKQARAQREVRYTQQRHAGILASGDPSYNPNLTLRSEAYAVTTELPKRHPKPQAINTPAELRN